MQNNPFTPQQLVVCLSVLYQAHTNLEIQQSSRPVWASLQ